MPLDLPGEAPSARKAHTVAGMTSASLPYVDTIHEPEQFLYLVYWSDKQHGEVWTSSHRQIRICKKMDFAALGKLVAVCGGHASEAGWFRTRTMVYHNDVTVLDRSNTVQWRTPPVQGEPPTAREYHTLTTVSTSRALLFGGQLICKDSGSIGACQSFCTRAVYKP